MVELRAKFDHERFRWLDQARGVVGLLFIVSGITWFTNGSLVMGESNLGPTYLDHGYNYYQGIPPMITIIDVGQSIFLFMVGLSGYIAFSSRLQQGGAIMAWRYAVQRVGVLYVLATVYEYVSIASSKGSFAYAVVMEEFSWWDLLVTDVIGILAVGAAATYLFIFLIRNGQLRAWTGIGLYGVHAFVLALYLVDRNTMPGNALELPDWPMQTIGLALVSILGSCFGQWIVEGQADLRQVMKVRVVPVACYCLMASYCMEWLEPSDHHVVNITLGLLAAGLTGLLIAVMYALYEIGIELFVLGALGRNLLLVFILCDFFMEYYFSVLPEASLVKYPFMAMVFLGMLPLVVVVFIARYLDTRNIMFRI